MQIFFGACLFFVAVVMLAYGPGKLLLLLLKRTLSPVEDFTLACVLGLVASGLAYWLIAFAHQAHLYVLWPLAITAVFVYLHAGKWKSLFGQAEKLGAHHEKTARRSRDRSGFALVGIIARSSYRFFIVQRELVEPADQRFPLVCAEINKKCDRCQRPQDVDVWVARKRNQPISETAHEQTENTSQSKIFHRAERPL